MCTDLGTASKDYLQDCYCGADLLKSKAELFCSANSKISDVDSFLYNLLLNRQEERAQNWLKMASSPPVVSPGTQHSLKTVEKSLRIWLQVSAERKSLRIWYLQKKSLCGFGICGLVLTCVTPLP